MREPTRSSFCPWGSLLPRFFLDGAHPACTLNFVPSVAAKVIGRHLRSCGGTFFLGLAAWFSLSHFLVPVPLGRRNGLECLSRRVTDARIWVVHCFPQGKHRRPAGLSHLAKDRDHLAA